MKKIFLLSLFLFFCGFVFVRHAASAQDMTQECKEFSEKSNMKTTTTANGKTINYQQSNETAKLPNKSKSLDRVNTIRNNFFGKGKQGADFASSESTAGVAVKPAIYLYPEEPVKVNISLDRSIEILVDIPKYLPDKGWHVQAYPGGRIQDLQPEYTDCSKIDSGKPGFEYAGKACRKNNYPYIFWEGKQLVKQIPEKKEGWVVDQKELRAFLNARLNEMDFSKQEKKEFISYWVPKLSNYNGKYLIYFLQNEEVDSYFPMNVNPKPESSNRICMVVKSVKSNYPDLKSQKLKKMVRKGFTLVDWGGIIL